MFEVADHFFACIAWISSVVCPVSRVQRINQPALQKCCCQRGDSRRPAQPCCC